MIIEAYTDLLAVMPANKITVTKIVEVADLNRSTFYAHFTNPNDVMEAIEQDIVDRFKMVIDNIRLETLLADPYPLIAEVTKFVEHDMELYAKLVRGNRESRLLDKLKNLISDKLFSDKETLKKVPNLNALNINLRFFSGAYTEILHDWLEGKIDVPLEELSIIVSKSIQGGIGTCME